MPAPTACMEKVGAAAVRAVSLSAVCDEYMLFSLAKWLGIHLNRVHGPSSDQSALLEALFSRFRLQWLCGK